ncbi:MAG TPA: 30S ribosomal protein S16 [Candidatus Saccharimonadales bacterium]|nr:30S ribosomal protein S16 [Candidatus Saccharimonadales bacterium]
MLVIRMQRTGRSGHAQFRVVVQDSRRTPTSGKIVAGLGHFNPHTKEISIDKEKASFFLEHGAQPSDRVARLLKSEGVKLPAWVRLDAKKTGAVRNADKRRSTRPDEPVAKEEPAVAEAETAPAEPEEAAATTETAETPEASKPEATEDAVAEENPDASDPVVESETPPAAEPETKPEPATEEPAADNPSEPEADK